MSEIDAIIEEIQQAAKVLEHRTSEHADRAMLDLLLRLAWRVQELETHQHTYFGPASMHGKWSTTAPQRDTGAAAQKVFLEQQAKKLADKKGKS